MLQKVYTGPNESFVCRVKLSEIACWIIHIAEQDYT